MYIYLKKNSGVGLDELIIFCSKNMIKYLYQSRVNINLFKELNRYIF